MNEYWLWLTSTEGVGKSTTKRLLEYYGTPENIYNEKEDTLRNFFQKMDIKSDVCENFIFRKKDAKNYYDKLFHNNLRNNINVTCIDDEDFPKKLLNIDPIPYVLYYRGKLPDEEKPSIAVVGARRADEYGMKMTYAISKVLASNGVQIISGMAMGIDKCAHEGAVSIGESFGILGCGVDVCYPQVNIETYMRLIESGGVISEYLPGSKALRHHFPERNRIISGLADGILVTQAKKKSGSLITVSQALEQGKNVYAIPGRITDELSEGCLDIIKEGAKCVTSPDDILEDYLGKVSDNFNSNLYHFPKYQNNLIENSLETVEKIVYASLRLESRHIEDISKEAGISLAVTMKILVGLQLKGLVKQDLTNQYSLDVSNIV